MCNQYISQAMKAGHNFIKADWIYVRNPLPRYDYYPLHWN